MTTAPIPTPDPSPAPAAPELSPAHLVGPTRRQFLLVWLAVSAVIVLAHFALAPRMGIYEDDHWLIGTPMCDWSASDLWGATKETIVIYRHGRPLHCGLGFALSYLGTHIGGLTGAYALAALVWSVNAGLCLALLWRPFGCVPATVAALVFVLVPADTTHSLLHTAFYVHTSVTFLLLSGNAYARGRPILSVFFAALTLLTYETCFLPALAWPLLFPSATRSLWLRCLVHGVALGVVLVLAVVVRMAFGEERAAGAMTDKSAVLKQVKTLATVGPKTALRTFVSRPKWTAKALRSSAGFARPGPKRQTVVLLAAGAGLAALLGLVVAHRASRPGKPADAPAATAESPASAPNSGQLCFVRLIAVGALMAVLGYVAALNREPQVIVGRMSSVHIASALGWGLFFAGLSAGVCRLLALARAAWLFPPAFAAYACLLAGFHVNVQREYIRAWVAQGEFWHDVAAECPDVRAGTIILYPLVKPTSEMVHSQEWADYLVFPHLFAVPPEWKQPPRAFPVGHTTWGVPKDYKGYDWNEVEREGDKLYWKHWGGVRAELEPGNVILLRYTPEGRFERVTGTVRMAGIDLQLKPREGPAFKFEAGKLYSAMFPNGVQADSPRRVSR